MKSFAVVLNVFTLTLTWYALFSNIPIGSTAKVLLLILFLITPPVNLLVFFSDKKNELADLFFLHFKITCQNENKKQTLSIGG